MTRYELRALIPNENETLADTLPLNRSSTPGFNRWSKRKVKVDIVMSARGLLPRNAETKVSLGQLVFRSISTLLLSY